MIVFLFELANVSFLNRLNAKYSLTINLKEFITQLRAKYSNQSEINRNNQPHERKIIRKQQLAERRTYMEALRFSFSKIEPRQLQSQTGIHVRDYQRQVLHTTNRVHKIRYITNKPLAPVLRAHSFKRIAFRTVIS